MAQHNFISVNRTSLAMYKMKNSVGPLLIISIAVFVHVAWAKSVFTFNDVLAAATANFNQKSDETNAFGPLKQHPLRSMSVFEPGTGSVMIKTITFPLLETVCPKSEDYQQEKCTFKENGSFKKCSSTATVLKSQPGEAASLTVSCEEVTDPKERKELSETPSWMKYFSNWN